MHVLPRPLPNEVVKGKHFVLTDLLKSLPGGSTQAKVVLEPIFQLDYLPLAMHDPKPAPQVVTKKKKKSGQEKAASEGLEGFVDWTNSIVSQSVEEREAEMSSLVARFAIQMRKLVVDAQEGTTPDLKLPGDKHFRPSRSDEEVQADPTVIVVDSPERVLEAPVCYRGCHPRCLSKCLCNAGG